MSPPDAEAPPTNGSEPRTELSRPVTVLSTLGMSVVTVPSTCERMPPTGAWTPAGSIGRTLDWMSAIALSIACVAIARLWVTSPTMELGSVPPLMALSRLTTSVASPAPNAVMIDATIGCALAGRLGSSDVRIWMICALPAIVGPHLERSIMTLM